jgi:hypothetical protein
VNGLLDDGRACSFPRQPVWLAAVLHLLTPEAPSSAVASHDHLRVDEQLRIATHVCVQLAGNLMHLIAITGKRPSESRPGTPGGRKRERLADSASQGGYKKPAATAAARLRRVRAVHQVGFGAGCSHVEAWA